MNRILSNKKCSIKNNYNFFSECYTTKENLLSPDITTISQAVAKESYSFWQGRKRTIK